MSKSDLNNDDKIESQHMEIEPIDKAIRALKSAKQYRKRNVENVYNNHRQYFGNDNN